MIPGSQALARLAIAQNGSPVLSAYLAESSALSDALAATGSLTYRVIETASLSDSETVERIFGGILSETAPLTDTIFIAPSVYNGTLAETLSIEDLLVPSGEFSRYVKIRINGMGWNYRNQTFYTWLAIDTETGEEVEVSADQLNERITVE